MITTLLVCEEHLAHLKDHCKRMDIQIEQGDPNKDGFVSIVMMHTRPQDLYYLGCQVAFSISSEIMKK